MYHLTNNGLPNVWLQDGYKTGTDKFGPYYSINDIPGLYQAIAIALAHGGGELTSCELRVVRRQLGLTQKQLADKLGRTEQTVLLWERDRANKCAAIPTDSAQLIKFMVLDHLRPDMTVPAAFRHIDQPRPERLVMTRSNGQWDSAINNIALSTVIHGKVLEGWKRPDTEVLHFDLGLTVTEFSQAIEARLLEQEVSRWTH